MTERKSRYEEIIVQVMPVIGKTCERQVKEPATSSVAKPTVLQRIYNLVQGLWSQADADVTQAYDALIYTNRQIRGVDYADRPAAEAQEPELAGLSFLVREQIIVHWKFYKAYLATFTKGEKAAYESFWGSFSAGEQQEEVNSALSNKLFELPSPTLSGFFRGQSEEFDRPVRVWWNCTPPELADLPWEWLTCELRKKARTKFSFVRGLPPDKPLPRVPVKGRLRLAFIHDPEKTPDALKSAIEGLKSSLDIVEMREPPREALQQAAKGGFELIHLVTDGGLSLGQGGLLYLRKTSGADSTPRELSPALRRTYRSALNYPPILRYLFGDQQFREWNDRLARELELEPCSTNQLSEIMRGTRVTLLSLSTPKTDETDPELLHGALLPSVYRAFASFGSSTLPLPNIIAPLGACADEVLTKFWKSFYRRLADFQSYSLEDATAGALQDAPTALMALFLRQRLGREFTSQSIKIGDAAEEPNQANAKLEVARRLIEQLGAIDASYQDIESRIAETPLVKREVERQRKLEEEISPLTQLEEGD